MNTEFSRQVRRLLVQLLVAVPSLLHHCGRGAWINHNRKESVSGKIPQDAHCR
jgi:hypothetical protein